MVDRWPAEVDPTGPRPSGSHEAVTRAAVSAGVSSTGPAPAG